MRRPELLLFFVMLGACQSAGQPTPPERRLQNSAPYPSGAEPNWVSEDLFFDPSESLLYAVGRQVIGSEAITACPKDSLLLKKAEAAARERLVASGATAEQARSAELRSAWFDGLGVLYVVAGTQAAAPGSAKHLAPKGGANGAAAIEAARAAIELELLRSGVCQDPHRRADFPCCGPTRSFCSDPTRFDRESPDGTCGCGEHEPCLYDFRCEERQGEKKCLCRGDKCPCAAMIKCKEGQTCQNGRCF